MKQKAITIFLTIIAVLAPLLIIPSADDSNYNILKLIVLLSAGLILLILLLASYKTLNIDKKDIVILIFMGLVFISTFLSSNIKISIIGEQNRYEGLLMFAVYIIIYFCSKKYFKYEKISIFINIMFWVSLATGILGIMQRYISNEALYPIFNKGICSTFGNSNFFGSFISIILPISAAIFILYGNKKSFVLSLIMFYDMISSGTRSAWLAFGVAGLVGLIYLIKQKNKKYFIRAGSLVLIFIMLFALLVKGFDFEIIKFINPKYNVNNNITELKLKQIKDEINKATKTGTLNGMGSHRMAIYKLTLELIIEKPVFGCGTDNLARGLFYYCPEQTLKFFNNYGFIVDKAHNEYLHIATTLGIPATVCYLIFIGLIIFPKIKLINKNNTKFCMLLGILSYLAQAFFNISTIGIAPLFWMMLGLIDNENWKIGDNEKNLPL